MVDTTDSSHSSCSTVRERKKCTRQCSCNILSKRNCPSTVFPVAVVKFNLDARARYRGLSSSQISFVFSQIFHARYTKILQKLNLRIGQLCVLPEPNVAEIS